MCDVVEHDLLFHPSERSAYRCNLRDDVDAITILIDHPRDAAHLALDPAQSLGARCLDVFAHAVYIPLEVISCKPEGTDHGPCRPRGEADRLLFGRVPSGCCRSERLAAGSREHDLYVSDAPADPAGRSRLLPDLRHGARAGIGLGRSGAEPRTRGHDAPVLGRDRKSTRLNSSHPSISYAVFCL